MEPITGAAVDLGSNTFRLLVAKISDQGITSLVKRLVTVRLGKGLSASNVLDPATEERALRVLADFLAIMGRHRLGFCRACGTAALRQVADRSQFLQKAAAALGGVAIEVISGEEEASLTFLGASAALHDAVKFPILLADVGGGSTELVWKKDSGSLPITASLPLGAVTLTEQFLRSPIPTEDELGRLRRHIGNILAPAVAKIGGQATALIGSGGTATSLAALDLKLERYDEKLIQGYRLSSSRINELFERLVLLTPEERNFLPGLEEGRGDIIVAGAAIYQEILAITKSGQEMIISDAGLLEGILLSGFRDVSGQVQRDLCG